MARLPFYHHHLLLLFLLVSLAIVATLPRSSRTAPPPPPPPPPGHPSAPPDAVAAGPAPPPNYPGTPSRKSVPRPVLPTAPSVASADLSHASAPHAVPAAPVAADGHGGTTTRLSPASSSTANTTTTTTTTTTTSTGHQSLITSSIMVIVSEIGDKTFLVAAILAMTHPRLVIFAGAWSALAVMSVLSALLGNVLPSLLSRTYTQTLAALLFLVFGMRMMHEARNMDPDIGTSDEMAQVQAEIKLLNKHPDDRLERGCSKVHGITPTSYLDRFAATAKQFAMLVVSPVFVETFVLTFLAEWGDRSQIATIAMSAAGNVVSVIIGTIVGHSLCTCIAVIGGKMLAARISVRTVTLIGGFVFLLFALLTFVSTP